MNDAEKLNNLFERLADDYGYEGELNKFAPATLVVFTDIVENMVRLFECRSDAEIKRIKTEIQSTPKNLNYA